ncbi:MAG: CHAP domain-containing protein, partial [Acidimicrobiales bacterium]
WEVASDGGIFTFGAAHFSGSMGGFHLNAPIVGISATPTGHGYWEVASDGGIFTFGTAKFYGSMGRKQLNEPIVGLAATSTGHGYWEVASDGGIFTFGSAVFGGSMGGKTTGGTVVGMAADRSGPGYWEVASRGEAFNLGTAAFEGDIVEPATAPTPSVVAEGNRIASVADSQIGQTNPYLYGPDGSTWCAFFTSWVWRDAGIPIPETGPAADVGTWALASGGKILAPTATPVPGDAVLWVRAHTPVVWPNEAGLNYPNIEHVSIVTQVLSNGDIVTVGGNEDGAVRAAGPFAPANASSSYGKAIYGYAQPPAG